MSPTPLETLQQQFADWLLGETVPDIEASINGNGMAPSSRLQVYRNLVLGNLTDALATAYPMVQRLVGDEFFDAVSAAYIREYPSRSGKLQDYGRHFADLLDRMPELEDFAYLPDVARLEWARQESALAPLASALPPAALAQLPAARYETVRLALAPSLRMVRSRWPVMDIWLFCQAPQERTLNLGGDGQDVAIWRAGDEIAMLTLDPAGAALTGALQSGRTLGEAQEVAAGARPDFDPAPCLAWLFSEGLVTGVDAP